jgi:hypothetical protein
MALGSTKPLTEMSTRNIPGGEGRPAHKADLTAICEPIVYKNVGTSTSHSPMGLHGPLQGYLYLLNFTCLVLVVHYSSQSEGGYPCNGPWSPIGL